MEDHPVSLIDIDANAHYEVDDVSTITIKTYSNRGIDITHNAKDKEPTETEKNLH